MLSRLTFSAVAALLLLASGPPQAQSLNRYALVLEDVTAPGRLRIEAAQASLKSTLAARDISVTGSAKVLLNAVFVAAPPERLAELQALPGVRGVVRLHRYHRNLNAATQLLNSSQAWALLGGALQAGAGVKIGIIDSGIDQNHPSLTDPSLLIPAGFPKCGAPADCAEFTNNKVIVARSYVRQLALGAGTIDPATSRPDDYSARDRSGHGTAVATCAAGRSSAATVNVQGMAPRAWLGSYKVFGSPQVNDFTTDDVLVSALEDALADGMDIVSVSIGGPALTGPVDTGAACGQPAGVPCDIAAYTFEQLARQGVLVVAAAGNEGADGVVYPTFNSVSSPGSAPSVLTVGGSSNSHRFLPAVRLTGSDVPASLALIPAQPTDAGSAYGASAASVSDVAQPAGDPYACSALPAASLTETFALVSRGPESNPCLFSTKMANVVRAGAAGMIVYDTPDDPAFPFAPTGLRAYAQPAAFLSNADGERLRAFIASHPGRSAVIDPAGFEDPLPSSLNNQLVYYSSMGPSTAANGIKPDVLAVAGGGQNGDLIFMGAQSFDPLGDVYSATGYIAAAGTSFATPLAAGAAALVKQQHPAWSAAQIKSALVNTASQDVVQDDSGEAVNILQTGAGKIASDLALRTTITAEPATLSFGVLNGALPVFAALRLTNQGAVESTLRITLAEQGTASIASLNVAPASLTLAPGNAGSVNVSLSGDMPAAGLYYGALQISGGPVALRVPYMYLVGSGRPANLIPLLFGGDGTAGQPIPEEQIAFRITDENGVPVVGAPATFSPVANGAPLTLSNVSDVTDRYGVAYASVTLGPRSARWAVDGCAGQCSQDGLGFRFGGIARVQPAIFAGGVVNAAAAAPGTPLAPGSYFSIYGDGLSDTTRVTSTAALPLALDRVNISFDVPAAGLSVPAHLVFVSPGQINAQVPWELQGQTSAQMKVTIAESRSNVVAVPLASAAPALFENPAGSGTAAAIDPANAAVPIIGMDNPARRGSVVSLYANGLGPVTNQPASGDTASAQALARTIATPVVTIGGQPAAVSFSGLTPGLPGLYQLNVAVPASIAAGRQPVVLSISGQTAKTLFIDVK